MNSVGSVPVVHRNLRDQEALLQLFDALADLDAVVNSTFNRVIERVNEEALNVYEVQKRVVKAASQVEYMQDAMKNKATRILCAPRYPGKEAHSYTPVHGGAEESGVSHTRFYLKDLPHLTPAQVEQDPLLPEILGQEARKKDYDDEVAKEGLGRLPDHLPSVSGLILFNSTKNPYRGYANLDNLRREGLRTERDIAQAELQAQPTTIKEGMHLEAYGAERVDYQPEMGEVPGIADGTNMLPGLANVAEISPEIDQVSIAPSSLAAVLPEIDAGEAGEGGELGGDVSAPASTSELPGVDAPPPPPPPADVGGPPPPPPPPGAEGAPPPPPPPPPSADNIAPPPPSAPSDEPLEEGRGGLLAEIARGRKLKTVDVNPEEEEAARSINSAPGIFGDLIQALNRRRKGMGGALVGDSKEKPAEEKNEFELDNAEIEHDSSDWDP